MEKIYYQTLKETLFHEKLENGLEVYLLPKIDFEKTYGLFSTRFGSIDTTFVPLGQKEMIKVEDGIAHFLEHKMFDMENGDAADELAAGAVHHCPAAHYRRGGAGVPKIYPEPPERGAQS